jgi:DNA-directed RNA polymerase subunit RPC12/RpoP
MKTTGQRENRPFTIICASCERPLTAQPEWIGRDVECPHCGGKMRVPVPAPDGRPTRAGKASLAPRLEFNFGCPCCDTLLEGHTGLSGQPARCPTCGARLLVPEIDPRSEQPRECVVLEGECGVRAPAHAYAADGAGAPRLVRQPDGTCVIECRRCGSCCEVEADSCPSCGTPFTIDAATTVGSLRVGSRATASLVLGIVSLPLCLLLLPAVLAILLGLFSLRLGAGHRPPGRAIAGILLGILSLAAFAAWQLL